MALTFSAGKLVAVVGPLLGREEIIVIDRPQARTTLARRHPDERHQAAARAPLARDPIDVGDDADHRRDLANIEILHVDHQQRRADRVEPVEHIELPALGHDAVDDIVRKAVWIAHP